MIYRLRIPRAPLSYFVENLWFYRDLETDHAREKLLPDAAMELIIDLGEGEKKLYDARDHSLCRGYERCWISGMQKQFLVIGTEPGASMMGAHFRTGGAAPFFGFPLSELASQVVELDLIWQREILALREQLLEAEEIEAKFDLLEAFLLVKAQSRLDPDKTVAAALHALRSWPVIPLKELASRLGLSHKQMLARFDCRVGLTPKQTSRIFRFRQSLQAAHGAEAPDWSDLAADYGYYDQAHMIHEFQEFAGMTPAEYWRRRTIYPHYVSVD
ncbi:MAG TPA: helix-turn-helix domain-containing protein [Candidatus Sulfotelmatobacter sp.]|nr:helix-turn-helix domain-containing protein [Candidatus Sulfotelmatobacter sp.]